MFFFKQGIRKFYVVHVKKNIEENIKTIEKLISVS